MYIDGGMFGGAAANRVHDIQGAHNLYSILVVLPQEQLLGLRLHMAWSALPCSIWLQRAGKALAFAPVRLPYLCKVDSQPATPILLVCHIRTGVLLSTGKTSAFLFYAGMLPMQLIATALSWENLWLFMPKDPEADPVLQVRIHHSCQIQIFSMSV